jgi:hypothetical protein
MRLMRNIPSALRYVGLLGALLVLLPMTSHAAPGNSRTKKVVRIDKKISKLKSQLQKQFSKLTDAEKSSVVKEISQSEDADDDGLPNWLEDEDAVCDPDGDGDGVEDGDEFDDDEDGGIGGPALVEESGTLSAITDQSLTVNSLVFVINEQTVFLGSKNVPRPRSDFKAGICVEVEGVVDESLVAVKVKYEDDC